MERFSCNTLIVSGEDAVNVLKDCRSRRLLVLTEPRYLHTGPLQQVLTAAGTPELMYATDVDRNPTMRQAVDTCHQIRSFQPDLIIAFGGENVLDWGKASLCFSKHTCTLAAVPTAVSSGSEVSSRVTLTHGGKRHLLQDSAMRPAIALLDTAVTGSFSRTDISEGGFSLLSAALEAYTGLGGGFLKNLHAREAFASTMAVLPAALSGNAGARKRLQLNSVLTGLAAEETGLGLCRAMENSLGTMFGLSRGTAAAILLPTIIGCNAHAAGSRYAELSRASGLGGSREEIGIRNLRTGLIRLRRELGLPGTLVQAGVDIRHIWSSGKQIVEMTLEDSQCRNNPVTADDFVVRRILEEITGRI